MAVVPAAFYRQAKAWSATAPLDEIAIRSILSRAYYAAFMEAHDRAGYKDVQQNVHALTIGHYKSQTGIWFNIGNRLDALKTRRIIADYKLGRPCIKREAEGALADSRRVLLDLGVSPADL